MKYYLYLLLFFFTLLIFRSFFSFSVLMAGDLPYVYIERYKDLIMIPNAWDALRNYGLGGTYIPFLWYYFTSNFLIILLAKLGLEWNIIERLIYFFPFLLISVSSSLYLCKKVLGQDSMYPVSSFIFLLNTYILMIIGGGQVQIALAYAIAPFILGFSLNIFYSVGKKRIQNSLIWGLLLSLQALFDVRILYLTLMAVFLYYILYSIKNYKRNAILIHFIFVFIIPFVVLLIANLYWVIPSLLYGGGSVQELGSAFSSIDAVKYFSFAKLEQTVSLLHPYWPENIFGKVDFMKTEFLIFPILAWSSALFMSKDEKRKLYIVFFLILGLLSSFLAKGANEPFGEIYIWLFSNIPGFSFFRDPIKFYTLTAISYSVLIPYTLQEMSVFLNKRFNKYVTGLFSLLIGIYFMMLLTPAFTNNLAGIFRGKEIPKDYVLLKNFIQKDKSFYRTLWIPGVPGFGFYSNIHPAISGGEFYKEYSIEKLPGKISDSRYRAIMENFSVRYIIVPYDSEEELFLKDRKYYNGYYENILSSLQKIPWLVRKTSFGKNIIFENKNYKAHFWSPDRNMTIESIQNSPSDYRLTFVNANKGDVMVFAEYYDKNWQLTLNTINVGSEKYQGGLNSFKVPESGTYNAKLIYSPQNWVNNGLVLSTLSFLLISLIIVYLR